MDTIYYKCLYMQVQWHRSECFDVCAIQLRIVFDNHSQKSDIEGLYKMVNLLNLSQVPICFITYYLCIQAPGKNHKQIFKNIFRVPVIISPRSNGFMSICRLTNIICCSSVYLTIIILKNQSESFKLGDRLGRHRIFGFLLSIDSALLK